MKRFILAALLVTVPIASWAASWENVPLVDHNCSAKEKANPDDHTTACLLQCSKSGYGILDHGAWIRFDKTGNDKALSALKATNKKDHVRVNVTGEKKGSVIYVSALTIPA